MQSPDDTLFDEDNEFKGEGFYSYLMLDGLDVLEQSYESEDDTVYRMVMDSQKIS